MKHTPYDGSSKPFTIGLVQLEPERWIEPDDALDYYLQEKARLLEGSAMLSSLRRMEQKRLRRSC